MKTTNLTAVVLLAVLAACGGPDEALGPPEKQESAEASSVQGEATSTNWAQATWVDTSTPAFPSCVSGVYNGYFVTGGPFGAVNPPALLGTVPAGCCPTPRKVVATCSCPQHGHNIACDVLVGADCSLTLVGHSEYNQSVSVKW